MRLKDLASKFNTELSAIYEESEAHAIFLIAVKNILQYNRADYLLKKENTLTTENINQFIYILAELLKGKPIQYILGEAQFYGLTFKVSEAVLIPRPETEELVEWILEKVGSQLLTANSPTILDIGTGSGCIAIALKKNLPHTVVYALDIAADSLEIARQNATLNNVELDFIQQDILQTPNSKLQAPGAKLQSQYTIIVSNPPYIKEEEQSTMHQNVLAHEPHRALFVDNETPLVFYEAIADFALTNLAPNGLLFFEINEQLGEQTINLLADKGFINIVLKKDLQGKDRMICCALE